MPEATPGVAQEQTQVLRRLRALAALDLNDR